jgi:hypothetical protein
VWALAFGLESGSSAAVMLTEGSIVVAAVARRIVNRLMLAVSLVGWLHAQDATYPPPKPISNGVITPTISPRSRSRRP